MSISKCPKCEKQLFEVVENGKVKDSNYKLLFVQCSSCHSVLGILDFINIGAMLQKQNVAIKKIAKQIGTSVDL